MRIVFLFPFAALLAAPALAETAKPPLVPVPMVRQVKAPRVTVDIVQVREEDRTNIVRLVQPANDPATWATVADLPTLARAEQLGAWTQADLTTDATGAITKCDGSGHADRLQVDGKWVEDNRIDWLALTCKLVQQRAKLKPALATDRSSQPGKIRVYVHYQFIPPGSTFPGGLKGAPPPPLRSDQWPPPFPSYNVVPVKWAKLDGLAPRKDRASWTGDTGVSLVISDAGAVTECTVRKSSGVVAVDEATCAGMKASTFQIPRLSSYRKDRNSLNVLVKWAQGKAVILPGTANKAYPRRNPEGVAAMTSAAHTAYPPDARAAKASGITEMEITFDSDRRVTSCYVVDSSGHDSLDLAACAQTYATANLVTPGTDVFGQPIGGRISGVTLEWTLPTP